MRGDTENAVAELRANEAALVHLATVEHYDTDQRCPVCDRANGIINRYQKEAKP